MRVTSVKVNTGRRVVEVKTSQLWRQTNGGRLVLVERIRTPYVEVRNWKNRRVSRIHQQSFVKRYAFVTDYVAEQM